MQVEGWQLRSNSYSVLLVAVVRNTVTKDSEATAALMGQSLGFTCDL